MSSADVFWAPQQLALAPGGSEQQNSPAMNSLASFPYSPVSDDFFSFDHFLASSSFSFEQQQPTASAAAVPPIHQQQVPAATVSPSQLSLAAPFHYQQHQDGFSDNYYVQRHVPSTRAYAYHPYGQPSPNVALSGRYQQHQHHHAHAHHSHNNSWETRQLQQLQLQMPQVAAGVGHSHQHHQQLQHHQQHNHHHHHHQYNSSIDYSLLADYSNNYPATIAPASLSLTVQPAQLCADPHSFEANRQYDPSSEYSSSLVHQHSEPASPVSPYQSSKDDSDPISSPSSTGQSSEAVSIASASVSPKATILAPGSRSIVWSPLPSPVESNDSDKEDDLHVPSQKKHRPSKSRRTTRSAPEPAWVEAVLAEDPLKQRAKNANRPIAFACVFCRHRKIQCIRPKMDLAPGERPAPCNQCEKRSRTCEYPPAVLNPRTTRRVKVSAKNDD